METENRFYFHFYIFLLLKSDTLLFFYPPRACLKTSSLFCRPRLIRNNNRLFFFFAQPVKNFIPLLPAQPNPLEKSFFFCRPIGKINSHSTRLPGATLQQGPGQCRPLPSHTHTSTCAQTNFQKSLKKKVIFDIFLQKTLEK